MKQTIGCGAALVALSLLACSSSDGDAKSGAAGSASGGNASSGGSKGASASSGANGSGAKSGANGNGANGSGGNSSGANGTGGDDGSGANGAAGDGGAETPRFGPTYFRFGVNGGYYGPGIDRRESAQMSLAVGASSLRTTLPEYYLEKWGDEIEKDDYAYYETELGLGHHACFLIGPTAAHSNAPDGVEDWELAHYSPKNLYEPIFLADDSVNPNNYWAAYVERVAKTYGKYLDIYEVWNEPDQVGGNWQATQAWDKDPPKPSDLVWWNDTVFSYIRMLRITHEVVHRFDDTAAVTTGGIGYGSYLSALLRYTDEPDAGKVTGDYPDKGGKYIDVVSYHYYPVFGGGSSDRGVDGLLEARDDYAKRLADAGEGERQFVVTENGAPRYALGDYPGGEEYSASYLVKSMTLGHYSGLIGIDWFAQGDGAAQGASTDSFDYMGLYFDYSNTTEVADTSRTPQGDAYAWLSKWLPGTAADPAALSALSLPSNVRGAAFKKGAGKLYVLWAKTEGDESATTTCEIPSDVEVTLHSFHLGDGERTEKLAPDAGKLKLGLTGMPFAIEVP